MKTPEDGSPALAEPRSLDEAQLARLEKAFRSSMETSRRRADYTSRRRLWLIFLLLRSTGARLGEVLGLDPTRDLLLEGERPTARFGGNGEGREVPLPADVAAALREALADPTLAPDAARLFDMDQGHVRRKFYERAEAAGLPRELASPSVLRRSRGVSSCVRTCPCRGAAPARPVLADRPPLFPTIPTTRPGASWRTT